MGQRGPDRERVRHRGVPRELVAEGRLDRVPLPRRAALHRDVRDLRRVHERRREADLRRRLPARPTRSSASRTRPTCSLIEATLPRPERTGMRGHLTPREAGEHGEGRGRARLVLTHISDELDCCGPWRRRPTRSAAVELAREGAVYDVSESRLRQVQRHHALTLCAVSPRAGSLRATSSACGARWTSCSATSSAHAARRRAAAGSRPPSTSTTPATRRGRSCTAELAGHRHRRTSGSRSAAAQLVIAGAARAARGRGAASTSSSRSSTGRSGASSRSGADVDADAGAGDLRGRHPRRSSCRSRSRATGARRCRSSARRSRVSIHDRANAGEDATSARQLDAARGAAGAAAARHRPVPGHADAAGGRPGALGPARQRRAGRQPHARDGRRASDPEIESPGPDELYDVGVVGVVARMLKVPDGTLRILVQGGQRVRASSECVAAEPYLVARDRRSARTSSRSRPSSTALHAQRPADVHRRSSRRCPYLPEELQIAVANLDDPSALAHLIAGSLRLKTEEKQELLEERDVAKRLRRLSELLARELEVISIGSRIQSQVQSEIDQGAARVLPAPAAQGDPGGAGRGRRAEAEVDELREQLEEAELPEEVREAGRPRARRGWRSCRRRRPSTASSAPTSSGSPTLPWDAGDRGQPRPRSTRARCSTRDHYDIEKVKDRILEFLAVRKLKPGRARLDPLLRRPARRRQDVAGQVDRPRARPQVRAHLRRRRARRGRDPRPPPHLHRRDARA